MAQNKTNLNNPEFYRLRQQITEHQFGTLKRQWDFSYTLVKGKQHVLTEVNLIMMSYNLKRLLAIWGPERIKERFKELFLENTTINKSIKHILSTLNLLKNIDSVERKFFKTSVILP
ncbi:transposase [Robertkochia solimangrovi]|uniref:transposase n=1 Tax=Robertkochia solimangrovi TaxID=2213046 RepID=UPI003BB188C5